ncbi:hypothetical protein [Enterobacter asburiae]|nr:hypothetical protein [Enterobacter asburiae]KLF96901.1 hypothetical protein YA44_03755 [Enterobacter asburiae]KLP49909.1 hypothetical protein ABF55_03060 [Enterobacter asburiae]
MTIKYLRMMKAETDQLPLIIRGERDCLAVRTFVMVDETTEVEKNIDVVLDTNGHFIHLAQGISLTIPPKTNIPPFLFKPKRALTCYSINGAALDGNEHLMFIEDSETHAMIVPKYDMHILEYEKHLEATRPLWEVQNDDEE